jgi:hypothetical protein
VGAATDLYDHAKDLLDFCVVALDELPAGAPERAYVAVGLPAIDCEQLTVNVFQVGEELSASGQFPTPMDRFRNVNPYPRVVTSVMVVTIVRDCYPVTLGQQQVPEPPSVAQLVEAAETIYADAWQLWNAVKVGLQDGAIFQPGCKFVGWQPMQPLGPAGETAGWTLPLQVQIDGFDPPPPV